MAGRRKKRRWAAPVAVAGILGYLFYLFGIQDGGWLGDRARDEVPQDSAPDAVGDAGGGGAGSDRSAGSGVAGVGAGAAKGDPSLAVADRLWGCLRRLEVAQIELDYDAGYSALAMDS